MRLRAFALLWFFAACSTQAQYKWTEPEGQTAYGDQAPRDATHVERLGDVSRGSADSADTLAQLPYEIRRAAKDFPVVLYTMASCAVCDEGRAFLKTHAIPFTERSIATRDDMEAFRQLGGGEQLPAMAVGRRIVRGFESSQWSEALADAGYPQGVPLPSTWQWPAAKPLVPPPAPPPAATADESADVQH